MAKPPTIWTPSGKRWALAFNVSQVLSNQYGDRMEVDILGWVLAYVSDHSVWIDGVYPGGLAAQGSNLESAKDNWVASLAKVCVDIAHSTSDANDFRTILEQFVKTTDDDTLAELQPAIEPHLAKHPPYCKVEFTNTHRRPKARASNRQPQQSNIKQSFSVAVPA